MQTYELTFHPAFPPHGVTRVEARWGLVEHWLQLRWRVEGAGKLLLPPFAGRGRRDGLWQGTCGEMFVQPRGGSGYAEYNFSPSEAWAAYDFTGWRKGMAERPLSHDPVITPRLAAGVFILDVAIPLADLPPLPAGLSLTFVAGEQGGTKSYWSMALADADRPDFHDPACFAAALPAAGAA